jgi:hypothetical protein
LKLPIDEMPAFRFGQRNSAYGILRENFFKSVWWEVFNYLEFVLNHIPDGWKRQLKQEANSVLRAENSAYRIVGDRVIEISNETEIAEIETALDKRLLTVNAHLCTALDLLSDKQNPDYRNSIKESISAVEAACQAISGREKATLGDCLKSIRDKLQLHSAFEQALSKLYGYTSDADGIRHALTEGETSPSYADAKFMLVLCSAFVNYLWTKAAELGIPVEQT